MDQPRIKRDPKVMMGKPVMAGELARGPFLQKSVMESPAEYAKNFSAADGSGRASADLNLSFALIDEIELTARRGDVESARVSKFYGRPS